MTNIPGIGVGELPVLSSEVGELRKAPDGASSPSFADALGKAVSEVEKAQTEADGEVQKAALGGGNLHEAMLALEKADVSMRLAMKIRNKVVDAYQEVMRMTV